MDRETTPEIIFGARLRAIRERRRVSQAELGERVGQLGLTLHQTQIARIELGRRALRLNEATALAQVLNIPLQSLIEVAADAEDDTADHGDVMELEAMLEEQRRALTELILAAGEAREGLDEAQAKKEQAAVELERAKHRFAAASAVHNEVSAAHQEMIKRVSEVHGTMAKLEERLQQALRADPARRRRDEADDETGEHLPEAASDELEVEIPYDDSTISIRIEQTGPEKWNYVIHSGEGAELLRSGGYSSEDRVRYAREIVKRKIVHERKRIEDIGPLAGTAPPGH